MKMTQGKVTFSVMGLGGRASAYLSALQAYAPHAYQLAAVADPDPAKQARARSEYGLGEGQIFDTDLDMMAQPRLSDVAIIATQDKLHLRDIRGLLEKGYDLILEKPVATTLDELREVAGLSRAFPGQMVAVCHVLRHSPFFERLRQIIASGQFGPVVSIQHNENIGYYHFAHSYVRGPWNNEQTSGPLTLRLKPSSMSMTQYCSLTPTLSCLPMLRLRAASLSNIRPTAFS